MQTGHNQGGQRRGTFARLAADKRGNTMLMMAAALFPIIGMAGSAFDMSRAYMVKTRLQQACDAGALAGRRAMTEADFDDDETAIAEADRFFEFNYADGAFGTSNITFDATGTDEGQVTATAAATVPMTLMQIFNVPEVNMNVECDAILEIANTDIMFVLDVTGSMNCAAADTTGCTNNGGVEKSNARIRALRTAVVDFYDTLDEAVTNEARLRFGFVPYSHGVRVGGLLPASYISDAHTYQSRVANFATPRWTPSTNWNAWGNAQTFGSLISTANCTNYGNNVAFTQGSITFNPSPAGNPNPPSVDVPAGSQPSNVSTVNYRFLSWTGSGSNRTCQRERRTATTAYTRTGTYFTNWTYRAEPYDNSQYKAGNAVSIVTGLTPNVSAVPSLTSVTYDIQELSAVSGATGLNTGSFTWNGCIEERDTVSNATFPTIPSNAFDLDIDATPSSNETRWRPARADTFYTRPSTTNVTTTDNGNDQSNNNHFHPLPSSSYDNRSFVECPKAATRLAEMTRTQVFNYVNASDFIAVGGTYHDVGMIWGARLLSPTGIFAADNATAPNGKPIGRHIIFMTDGQMSPNQSIYGLYGQEKLDRRVGGGTDAAGLLARHNARYAALCDAVKAKNVTIWVVAYATGLTANLTNCADPGRAFTATNDVQLRAQFRLIASKIAELRLAQ